MKVGIGKAAAIIGVTKETLRRWEMSGKIDSDRTPKGHRRYDLSKLTGADPNSFSRNKRTLAYARVSSHDQKADLKTQVALLESFCAKLGNTYEVIQDLGSGLNYDKKGLKKLIKEICCGTVERLVITHKDRLLRFGAELIFSLCEQFGTEVIIMNAAADSTFEEDLAQDVLEIITVFSARLYGSRSRKNKKLLEALKDAASEL
jgi:putative resolvase